MVEFNELNAPEVAHAERHAVDLLGQLVDHVLKKRVHSFEFLIELSQPDVVVLLRQVPDVQLHLLELLLNYDQTFELLDQNIIRLVVTRVVDVQKVQVPLQELVELVIIRRVIAVVQQLQVLDVVQPELLDLVLLAQELGLLIGVAVVDLPQAIAPDHFLAVNVGLGWLDLVLRAGDGVLVGDIVGRNQPIDIIELKFQKVALQILCTLHAKAGGPPSVSIIIYTEKLRHFLLI